MGRGRNGLSAVWEPAGIHIGAALDVDSLELAYSIHCALISGSCKNREPLTTSAAVCPLTHTSACARLGGRDVNAGAGTSDPKVLLEWGGRATLGLPGAQA